MAGATFTRYMAFDPISGENVVGVGASIASGVAPEGARIAILTTPVDIRYSTSPASAPVAVVDGPLLQAGSSIPLSVRAGSKVAIFGTGTVNIAWCR